MHAPRILGAVSLAFTSSGTTNSPPIPSGVNAVRIISTAPCYISIGNAGTVVGATATYLTNSVAGAETFRVSEGEIISVLGVSSGTLNISYVV